MSWLRPSVRNCWFLRAVLLILLAGPSPFVRSYCFGTRLASFRTPAHLSWIFPAVVAHMLAPNAVLCLAQQSDHGIIVRYAKLQPDTPWIQQGGERGRELKTPASKLPNRHDFRVFAPYNPRQARHCPGFSSIGADAARDQVRVVRAILGRDRPSAVAQVMMVRRRGRIANWQRLPRGPGAANPGAEGAAEASRSSPPAVPLVIGPIGTCKAARGLHAWRTVIPVSGRS